MRKAGLGLLCLMVAACGGTSPENRYFTLSPVGPAAPSPSAVKPPLRMTGLHLPSLYDRPQMVIRTGPQSIGFDEYDRWAEPLERMAARILAQDIALRRPRPTGPLPSAADQPRVQVSVDEFAADSVGVARLSGTWRITGADDAARAGDFSYSAPVEAGRPDGVAAAMSALLGRLADEIDRN